MPDTRYDLMVIGFGAAGLSAAVSFAAERRATDRSARIAVLERAGRETRGGATRWTSSWFRITEDRQLDPNFVPQMERVSGGLADLDYCRRLQREVPNTLEFLETNGVELIYFKQPFPNRNTGGGLGMPARGGIGIVEGLAAVIEADPDIDVFYETEAFKLDVASDGRVSGVIARGPTGALETFAAPNTVIACGGFEGNPEMLTRYLGERACDLTLIAPTVGNNRGDGLRMALDVGADTAGQFDMFHGEPVDRRSSKPDPVIYGFPYGIVVNGQAQRFYDEGKDSFDSTFEEIAFEIYRYQNQTAFFIGDQTTLAIPNIDKIQLTDRPPIEANTIPALAEKLGLDAEALQATIDEFNASIGSARFDPTIRDGKATSGITPPKSNWAFAIASPPYIAYPLTCAITFTFGGIRTNTDAQVVAPSGVAIPGLYAAGEVTGLYYHSYPAGTSVLRSATFGRLAGCHAAQAED